MYDGRVFLEQPCLFAAKHAKESFGGGFFWLYTYFSMKSSVMDRKGDEHGGTVN